MTTGPSAEGANKRSDYRVTVPPEYLRGLAIWLRPSMEYTRLGVADLGRPDISLASQDAGSMAVSNLSIRGMGLALRLPDDVAGRFLTPCSCLTWIQLLNPTHDDPYGVLSVFTLNSLARLAREDGMLFLGIRFLRFAVGSRLEKALEFLDAQSCGVTSLARWCDNLGRGALSQACGRFPGLDMDHLLEEIEATLAARAAGSGDLA